MKVFIYTFSLIVICFLETIRRLFMEPILTGLGYGLFFLCFYWGLYYLVKVRPNKPTTKTNSITKSVLPNKRYKYEETGKVLKELGKLSPGDKVPVGILWSCMGTFRDIVEGHVHEVVCDKSKRLEKIKVSYFLDGREVTQNLHLTSGPNGIGTSTVKTVYRC